MNKYLFNVPNNEEGKNFIRFMRKLLRNTPRAIKLRGRGPRYGNPTYCQELPHKLSREFAVYLYNKPTTQCVRVVDLNSEGGWRYVQQPTKWYRKNA